MRFAVTALVVCCLLLGCEEPKPGQKKAKVPVEELSIMDQGALDCLKKVEWEKNRGIQDDDRARSVRIVGLNARDSEVSDPIRQKLIACLADLEKNDKSPLVRREAAEQLARAPKK